jgi:peptidyl-prolyl cis-trans isomerase SurA
LVATLGLVAALGARAEVVDQIAATVDKEVILYSDVISEVAGALREAQLRASSAEDFEKVADKMIRDALEQAVESRILYREALLAGVTPDEKAIDQQVNDFKAMFDTAQAFEDELKAAGITMNDLRDRIKKQRMAASLASYKLQEFEKEVVVSEAEVSEYYNDNSDEFNHPERVFVRQIFLAAPEGSADRAKVVAQLQMLKQEIADGAAFGDLAKAHSQAPGAEQGGLVGWQKQGDLVEPLNSAAFGLQAGQVSDVIETPNGVHLIQVEQREEAGVRNLNEVRTEIEPLLRRERAQERFKTWMNELRKRSRVRVFL